MTPAQAIGMLDRGLARGGATVTVSRTGETSVTTRAKLSGFSPSELDAGIVQMERRAILSPTQFAGWDAPPAEGDRLVVDGRSFRVSGANPVRIGATIVRIELEIAG